MKAIWNNTVLAQSDETIEIEGNHYFPPTSLAREYFEETDYTTTCVWKGVAHYYTVVAAGARNENAAWYYPEPKVGSIEKVGKDFTNYVAFWKGVEIQ